MCVFGNVFNVICNTFASFTAVSGSPTIANELVPLEELTSISTVWDSTPLIAPP